MAETIPIVISILQSENIAQITFKSIGPKVRPGPRIDQLTNDADFPRCLAHTAFKYIADAEFAPDLLHIDDMSPVGEARIASDDQSTLGSATAL